MDVLLAAAERDGRDAVGGEPVGVQAAVGDGQLRLVSFRFDGRGGRQDTRLVAGQPKCFVIEPAVDVDFAAPAGRVANRSGGLPKRAFNLFDNLRTVKVSKQLDFRALVSFARRVVAATPVERDLLVLSPGSFPLAAAKTFGDKKIASYGIWGDMFLRWSEDFLSKLNVMASVETKRELGIESIVKA